MTKYQRAPFFSEHRVFIIVMDVVIRELKERLLWELLYADNLLLVATSKMGLKDKI
jgi:hypothetical protein